MKINKPRWGLIGSGTKAAPPEVPEYEQAIEKTKAMVSDSDVRLLAKRYKLDIVNISWEDTARFKNSAVGPNISDMSIQVGHTDARGQFQAHLMPVLRSPNFADISADLDPSDFALLVGNHEPGRDESDPLRCISLRDFLAEPTKYLTRPEEWKGSKRVLLSPRDDKVLVSAQACFLPIPKSEAATFNPVVFNYQSSQEDPAVLTILATREGTSVTVIDNERDAFESGGAWGQRLFFNQGGERASLSATRKSEFIAARDAAPQQEAPAEPMEKEADEGLNMVLLIQVPLKQKPAMRRRAMMPMAAASMDFMQMAACEESDVEDAVIGHGHIEGPFTEIGGLAIERDPRYPVRVTVQFYKATSNGVASDEDIKAIREQIDAVYANAQSVGSLVTQGESGRATEYEGLKVQPPNWWDDFWARYEKSTGRSKAEALAKLHELLGGDPQKQRVSDLYLRQMLRSL